MQEPRTTSDNLEKDLPGGEVEEPTNKSEKERLEILRGLAARVEEEFNARVKARKSKELEWIKCENLYNAPINTYGEDGGETPFNSTTKKRRPVPNIVRTKVDTAISNSVSMQFAGGEKNWDLFPAPNETDSENIDRCYLMEKEIETQLSQAKYALNSRKSMTDRVKLGTGVLKGPVNTGRRAVEYVKAGDTWITKVIERKSPSIVTVPLWRFYPDMSVTDFSEAEDAIEVHSMTTLALSQLIDHSGFDGEAIKRVINGDDSDPVGRVKPSDYNDKYVGLDADGWRRNPYLYRNRYLVFEYHGPVTYDEINKLGIIPDYESPTMEYYGEVWVCQGEVIRLELENIEGFYETPYSVSTWKNDPASLFGFGHPLLLADPQRVITQSYHMILDNASLTSGPQVAMHKKYIQPIDGDWTISPNKVWWLTDSTSSVESAIKFFYPTNVIGHIMPVLNLARQFAEEESATSSVSAGLPSPELGDTATGGLLMRQASTTLLDFLAEEWDDQVTEKVIRRMYAWNMQYNPKEEIKGNYIIDVKSSSEYKNKQLYIRDLERLQMETSQNPALAAIINTDELAKARLRLMSLPSNRIVKTDEEIAQYQQQQANQPNPAMIELQLKQGQLEIDKFRAQLAEKQLMFEMQQQQQRELWEHDEKMGANQARLAEANASVLKARTESQIEMIKLAKNDERFREQLMANKELAILAQQSRVFLEGMKDSRKAQEQELYAKEMDLKANFGSGI
mgnify:CR=1 FL=1